MDRMSRGNENLGSVNHLEQVKSGTHQVEFNAEQGKIFINGEPYTVSYGGKPIEGQKGAIIVEIVKAALQHISTELDNRTIMKMAIGNKRISYETTMEKGGQQVQVSPKPTNERIEGLFQKFVSSQEKQEDFEKALPENFKSPGSLILTQIAPKIDQQQNIHKKDITLEKKESTFHHSLEASEEFEDDDFSDFEDDTDIKEKQDITHSELKEEDTKQIKQTHKYKEGSPQKENISTISETFNKIKNGNISASTFNPNEK